MKSKKDVAYRILKPLALGAAILALASGCNEQQRCDGAKAAHAKIEHLGLLMSQALAPNHDDQQICAQMKPLYGDLAGMLGSMVRIKNSMQFVDGGKENRLYEKYARDHKLSTLLDFIKVSREAHVSTNLQDIDGKGFLPELKHLLIDADDYCGWGNPKSASRPDYIAPYDPQYPKHAGDHLVLIRLNGQKIQDDLCSDLEKDRKKYVSAREYERDADYIRITHEDSGSSSQSQGGW
ncbi:MAG: hypothetical protein ACXWPM_04005 [Bdellovibrionota bacterium]